MEKRLPPGTGSSRAPLKGLDCQFEHVGSTAIPGLSAKPILDIAVGVPKSANMDEVIRRLKDEGYEYRGDKGIAGGQLFICVKDAVVTHHVHFVTRDDPQWKDYLAVRELLSNDPEARQMYETAKRELAAKYPLDRTSYSEAKGEVLDGLLSRLGQG